MVWRALVAFLLTLVLALGASARAADVAIVLSDASGVYGEFATAFQQLSEGSAWRVRWTGSIDNIDTLPRTDLIVAVGSEAARAALRRNGGVPIVATLLPRLAYERAMADLGTARAKGSVTAIYLDQPIPRLLAFSRYLLPERHRVGLLVGAETRSWLPQIRQAFTGSGLTLETEEVDGNANPVPAASLLMPRSDVLLALPDSAVYRRDNIRAILLTSYRFQRPLIGFSQSLVSSGALAAIFSTPTQIARQTADLVRALHPDAISLPNPQAPALFAIAINQNVAQALGLTLPDEATIRRSMMADKDAK